MTFSQNGWPRSKVIDSDTVVCFTRHQANLIAVKRVELSKCTEYTEILENRLLKCSVIVEEGQTTIKALETERNTLSSLLEKHQKQEVKQGKELNKAQRKIKTLKVVTKVLAGCLIVVSVTLALVL